MRGTLEIGSLSLPLVCPLGKISLRRTHSFVGDIYTFLSKDYNFNLA